MKLNTPVIQFLSSVIAVIIISNQITAISSLLIPVDLPYKEFIINIPLFLLLIIINYSSGLIIKSKIFYHFLFLCSPLFIGYLVENIRYIVNGGEYHIFKVYVLFINLLITFFSLLILLNKCQDFLRVLKYYFYLNVTIAVLAVFIFILLQLNFINLESWSLPSFVGNAFNRKIEFYSGNFSYYFPLYLTIIASYVRDIGSLGYYGAFTGLSYEPHIAGFFMGPAFFMGIYFMRSYGRPLRIIVYFLFISFFLLATSLTNLISITLVLMLIVIDKSSISISSLLKTVLILILITGSLSIFFYEYLDLFYKYAEYKVYSRSGEESLGFITYILSPTEIFGDGIFNFPLYTMDRNVSDIGILGSLIFILIYLILISSFIYIYLYKRKVIWVSYALLYFILHSLKFPFHIIQYPFLLFIFALITYTVYCKEPLKYD